YHCKGDVAREVGAHRDQSEDIIEQDKEEHCKQVGHKPVRLRSDVGFGKIITHKNNNRLKKRLLALWSGSNTGMPVSACNRGKEQEYHKRGQNKLRGIFGDGKIKRCGIGDHCLAFIILNKLKVLTVLI